MKIKQQHFDTLKEAIEQLLAKYNDQGQLVKQYETGQIPRFNSVSDIQRRFCFDLLYGAGLSKFVCDELYLYMDDKHLYTALKRICPKLEAKQ